MVASLFVTTLLCFPSSILVTAFVGTALAFACFLAAAMLARRREYLGGGSAAVFKFEERRLIIYKSFFFFVDHVLCLCLLK
jgi:hypothetical protein